jgi:hypothetical protein
MRSAFAIELYVRVAPDVQNIDQNVGCDQKNRI